MLVFWNVLVLIMLFGIWFDRIIIGMEFMYVVVILVMVLVVFGLEVISMILGLLVVWVQLLVIWVVVCLWCIRMWVMLCFLKSVLQICRRVLFGYLQMYLMFLLCNEWMIILVLDKSFMFLFLECYMVIQGWVIEIWLVVWQSMGDGSYWLC